MEKQIKELQDYFVAKILAEEVLIGKMDRHVMELFVDGRRFHLWLANEPKNRKPYHTTGDGYFMELEFTDEQAILADSIYSPIAKKYQETVLRDFELKQLEELKAKYGDI